MTSRYDSTVLIADSEPAIRGAVAERLTIEGYQPLIADNGFAALRYSRTKPTLSLFDAALPGIDGVSLLRTIRAEGLTTPTIVTSRNGDEVNRVLGFEVGADDYVVKPFSISELMCRIQAILRRSNSAAASRADRTISVGGLEIDESGREIRCSGIRIALRPREFSLLTVLAKNVGVVLSRTQLIERAWGHDCEASDRAVDGHIRRTRGRFAHVPNRGFEIVTHFGVGYKLEPR